MSEAAPKRFYTEAKAERAEGGWGVFLDGRQARTLKRAPLTAPTEQLARAIADEWAGQGEHIDRTTMPLTALLSAAIDGGRDYARQCLDEVINYLNSDLVCYRAETPDELVKRQTKVWGAYVDWMKDAFGVSLTVVAGVIATPQPEEGMRAVREAIADESAETLLAIRIATNITGSAVLALALWKDAFKADKIFEAALLDERFQAERWGADAEAKAREARLYEDFSAVGSFLRLI